MRVYIFQAALLCETCGKKQIAEFEKLPPINALVDTGDSDDWPQGPYSDGGGEADCPQHCDHCGVFLENPLTGDGVKYVREKFNEVEITSGFDCPLDWHEFADRIREKHPVLAQWADEYLWYF